MPMAQTATALFALLAWASPVLAQGAVPPAPKGDSWITIVISIVLMVAVMVASFMSAKRGHQD